MINVAFARYLDDQHLAQIQSVHPSIRIHYDPSLVAYPKGREKLLYAAVFPNPALPDGRHFAQARSAAEETRWRAQLLEADVLFDVDLALRGDPRSVAPTLEWIQTLGVGVDGYRELLPGLVSSNIDLIATHGVCSGALADFAVAAILQHAKRFDDLRIAKGSRSWHEIPPRPIAGQEACILGVGHIGTAVAQRLHAFGIRVTGFCRHPDRNPGPYFQRLVGGSELASTLAQSDYVIVTLPLTRETHHLLNRKLLQSFKRGSYVVNVGRGKVIDEAELAAAIDEGHIAGAALDVFETEPLPMESPLWDHDSVIISPHTTGFEGQLMQSIVDLFCENLRRHVSGEPLVGVVDREAGY